MNNLFMKIKNFFTKISISDDCQEIYFSGNGKFKIADYIMLI